MNNYRWTKNAFLLFLILIIAFILRIWGVNFGLPGLFHVDERPLVYNSFHILTHKGKVAYYGSGSLFCYLLSFLYSIYYLVLKIKGVVQAPFDFLVLYIKNPTNVYLIGRIFCVISSTLSIFVVYLLGKKLYNKSIGLLSAFFLAVSFLSVQHAKYIKGDNLGILMLLLAFYFCIEAKKEFSCFQDRTNYEIKAYIIAGIFTGIAVALRFTLCIAPLALISICFMQSITGIGWKGFKKGLKNSLILISSALIVLLIVPPSIIFETFRFSRVVSFYSSFILQFNPTGRDIITGEQPVWLFYLTDYLRKGVGFPLWLLGTFGILDSLKNIFMHSKYKKEEPGLIIFLILFWYFILNHSLNQERYIIPIIPFFLIFAAKFTYKIVKILTQKSNKYKETVLICLSTVVVIPTLITTIKYNYLISRPDTRKIAKNFIEHSAPAESKIICEGLEWHGLGEQISPLGVQLNISKKELEEQLKTALEKGVAGKYLYAMIEGQNEPAYRLKNVFLLDASGDKKYNDVDIYLKDSVEYMVTCSWVRNQWHREMSLQFLSSLYKEYKLIKEFNPCPVFRWDPWCWRVDYEALSKVSIFDNKVAGGPIIRIYKRKDSTY